MSKLFILILALLACSSCSKSKFLKIKSDQSISEPSTIEEFQAILDNTSVLNINSDADYVSVGADEFYDPQSVINSFPSENYKNQYVWDDNIYDPNVPQGIWEVIYRQIFYANVAIDGINKIIPSPENQNAHNNVKGSGLFFRARCFYNLAQIYAPQYQEENAENTPGIVMRLKSDINETIKRSSLKDCYFQMIGDLKLAVGILPETSDAVIKNRPTKAAVYGMLAKIYLVMGNFTAAEIYADSCLQIRNTLIDYSTLVATGNLFPVSKKVNPEIIIFFSMLQGSGPVFSTSRSRVDSLLYDSYNINDARKNIFFRDFPAPDAPKGKRFKGSYEDENSRDFFTGISVPEILLIRAESKARNNRIAEAIVDLNALMEKRWLKNGTWVPLAANNVEEALGLILSERKREMIFRGTRWTDIRRLNVLGAGISQKRIMDGVSYELKPNDSRYTYLIPPFVMRYHPDMLQNARD